ncbi:hypothetical protein BT96DRAFT_949623 [Gymnopus androsaceus JB14]|uniref:Uncharacterized protein n=1 Tax=Gymnopus androsaceus JB14 TaxID=1447944 RepID=A0A6A4GK15_9AGAR|nr:hypothetical protein BT96DRAFT_949623 [Gymnopus androsaceus JB14]
MAAGVKVERKKQEVQAGRLLTPSPTPEFSPQLLLQRASSSVCDQPPTRPSSRATTGYMADDDGIGGRVDSPLYYNGEVSDLSDQVDTDYLGLPAVSDGESEISDFNSEESEEYSAVGTGKMTGPPHKHTHKRLPSDTTPNQSPNDPASIPYNVQPLLPYPGCRRLGQAPLMKRQQVSHDEELQDSADDEDGQGPQYEAVAEPALPSQLIQSQVTALMMCIAFGVSSTPAIDSGGLFVEQMYDIVSGAPWAQSEASSCDSLLNLAQQCHRGEEVEMGATFVSMIHELIFVAKINSILHYRQLQDIARKRQSIKPIIDRLASQGVRKGSVY